MRGDECGRDFRARQPLRRVVWNYFIETDNRAAAMLAAQNLAYLKGNTLTGAYVMCGAGGSLQRTGAIDELLAAPVASSSYYQEDLAMVVDKVNRMFRKEAAAALRQEKRRTGHKDLEVTVLVTPRGLELAYCRPLPVRLEAPVPGYAVAAKDEGRLSRPQATPAVRALAGSASVTKAPAAKRGVGKRVLAVKAGKRKPRTSG